MTGAAGFIGSHLVRRLLADGQRVVGMDAGKGTTTPDVAAARTEDLLADSRFDLLDIDLASARTARTGDLEHVLRGARAIFHLSGRPGARDVDAAGLRRENVSATERLLRAAENVGVDRLVLASSSSVYGDAGRLGPCAETGPTAPLSVYGETKLEAERMCVAAPLRATAVRLFTVYGAHQRSDMAFARFIEAARTGVAAPEYQGRDVLRDYTYVTDAVEGLVLAWHLGRAPVYNISGGAVTDLGTVCRAIEELVGLPLLTRPDAAPLQPTVTRADPRLAAEDLGYRPQVRLREGLGAQVRAANEDRARRASCSACGPAEHLIC